mgnify:FL=1
MTQAQAVCSRCKINPPHTYPSGRRISYCEGCKKIITRDSMRKRRAENMAGAVATNKRYADANREKVRVYHRLYKKNNKAKVKSWEHKRRASLRTGGSFTAEEWVALCFLYDNKCLRCRSGGNMTPDHVVPLAKGGMNTIDNIQPLCGRCNSWKRDLIIDYRRLPDGPEAKT